MYIHNTFFVIALYIATYFLLYLYSVHLNDPSADICLLPEYPASEYPLPCPLPVNSTHIRGVESSTISTSASQAVIKDLSTNYMTALGLNQAYTSLILRIKYNIVLICSFRSKPGNILQKQKVHTFSLYLYSTDDFRLILKTIWILKTVLKTTIFCRFSLNLMIFWI